MDARLRGLAEQLDGGHIARREFFRKAAILSGGTAAGLAALRSMAAWAKERNVEAEFDWATFGDREQKFVAAIEADNPPDIAEMNYQGPMRYKAALRDGGIWSRGSPLGA